MSPAGLMWSVVMESPATMSTRAPVIGAIAPASGESPVKNGGSTTYVLFSRHP